MESQYGDFKIDNTWKLLNNAGSNNYIAYNPSDPLNQRFAVSQAELTPELQALQQGNLSLNNLSPDINSLYSTIDPSKYGFGGVGDFAQELLSTRTLAQYADQKRTAELTKQIQAGTLSEADATRMANDPNLKSQSPIPSQLAPDTPPQPGQTGYNTRTNPNNGKKAVPSSSVRETVDEQGLAHDDPSKKYNTATGEPNARYNPASQAPTTNQEQTSAPTAFFSGANLSMGSRGPAVQQLQQALGITADGIFGPKTLAAVKSYQLSKGLKADGIVGPQTMAALNQPTAGPASGIESGISSGQTSANTPVEEEESPVAQITRQIKQALGIKDTDSPQTSASKILKQAYKDLGYDTMKKEYENQVSGYTDLQDKKNDEIQKINNDPWLSEGVRVQKLQQLDKKYEGKELIFQNKLKLLETNISNAREDAQFLAGETINQMQLTAQFNQDILLKAIDIAESQLTAGDDLTGPASVQEYKYAVSQGYQGSFSDYQNEDANRKAKAAGSGLGGMFSAAQINATINSIAGAFDNEPIVKNFNQVKSAYQFVQGLSNQTKNPTDDQALIYAFAKVMDPDSVVREGEYNTVQKYSQSWVNAFGKSVNQAIAGTGFLTEEARANIKKTIESKYKTTESTYNDLRNSYNQRIEDAKAGLGNTLPDYSSSTPTPTGGGLDSIADSLEIDEATKTAYLPRSIWSTLGANMDALLADVASDGYKLLIRD